VFSVEERDRVREHVLGLAAADPRVVAAAAVGGTASGGGDRERGRWWHAEYWISGVRDYARSLACRRRGLEATYGRGFAELPAEVLKPFAEALVRSLQREEVVRALDCAVAGLLREAAEVRDVATKVEAELRQLTAAT
jgi:hypothetical protein